MNRRIVSNKSCYELVELWERAFGPKNATEEFIENCEAVAEKTGNLNLFEEMFGTDVWSFFPTIWGYEDAKY